MASARDLPSKFLTYPEALELMSELVEISEDLFYAKSEFDTTFSRYTRAEVYVGRPHWKEIVRAAYRDFLFARQNHSPDLITDEEALRDIKVVDHIRSVNFLS